jgi:hypothetical protein
MFPAPWGFYVSVWETIQANIDLATSPISIDKSNRPSEESRDFIAGR